MNRIIFIVSSPRSGSTWLGKLFDSHSDTFYLHEPDIADRGDDLIPYWFDGTPTSQQVAAAGQYFDRLRIARSLRATGRAPFFRKSYRSVYADMSRRLLINVFKASANIAAPSLEKSFKIPDMFDWGRPSTFVIKSVSMLGRVSAIVKARQDSLRPIFLVRHPCGYVRSMLQGALSGVMNPNAGFGAKLDTAAARKLLAPSDNMNELDDVERLAWHWLIGNVEAHSAVRSVDGLVVIYEELTRDVREAIKVLFSGLGLDFGLQTENFISKSAFQKDGYYSLSRDPKSSANRWRHELSEKDIKKIRSIVTRDPIGQMFFSNFKSQFAAQGTKPS